MLKRYWRVFIIFDEFALLTAFGVVALQHEFIHLVGWIDNTSTIDVFNKEHNLFYFFCHILTFFSVIIIYNLDHFLDAYTSSTNVSSKNQLKLKVLEESIPSKLVKSKTDNLKWLAIIFSLIANVWVLVVISQNYGFQFIGYGMLILSLCSIHLILFHTRIQNILYPIKELSVTFISMVAVIYPSFYLKIATEKSFLNIDSLLFSSRIILVVVVLLVLLNSVWFYSLTRIHEDTDSGVKSVFHLFSFEQSKRYLLSFAFFIIITLLFILSDQDRVGERWSSYYFLVVVVLQSFLLRHLTNNPNYLSKMRITSEMLFGVTWLVIIFLRFWF